jgi:hypothetical protein
VRAGIIYVLYGADKHSELVKIGKSAFDVAKRAAELWTTGMPNPLQIAYSVFVADIDNAEAAVHDRLRPYRYRRDREFFAVPIEDAIATLESVAHEARLLHPELGASDDAALLPEHLSRKLLADLNGTLCSDAATTRSALTTMAARTKAIWDACGFSTKSVTDFYPGIEHIDALGPGMFNGRISSEDVAAIVRAAPSHGITCNIACNSAAAVAAGLLLKERLKPLGVPVTIDYAHTSGRNQLLAAFAAPTCADFLIVGQPAFAFSQLTAHDLSLPKDIATRYTAVLPLHREGQVMLIPRKTSIAAVKRIYTASRSAGEEPHRTQVMAALLKNAAIRHDAEVKLRDVDEILTGKTPIAPGAALQVWKPAHKGLAKRYNLVHAVGFDYDHLVGLFVRTTLITKHQPVANAISRTFCAAWNKLQRNPKRYVPLLLNEKNYVEAFRVSAGLRPAADATR